MEPLSNELKLKIIDILDLSDLTPKGLDADAPLVGGPLGLDSIDILEIVIVVEKESGVRIDNRELGERVFASLNTLAGYITENSPKFKN